MRAVLAGAGVPEQRRNGTVDEELMGRYLAWLVDAEFLPPPAPTEAREGEGAGRRLPRLVHAPGTVLKAVGRSSGN